MAASDNLYQFCGFFLSFAKILRSQKQEMETLHNISIFYSNFWWWNISYRRVFRGLLRICCPIIREEINCYTSKIHSLHNRSYNPIIFPWYFQLDVEDEFCTSANNFWRWLWSAIAQRWWLEAVSGIVERSYLSILWQDSWICISQEKHKAQFQCSLSIHDFIYLVFFTSLPLATDTDLFCHSRRSGEKQLLALSTVKLFWTLTINDWNKCYKIKCCNEIENSNFAN